MGPGTMAGGPQMASLGGMPWMQPSTGYSTPWNTDPNGGMQAYAKRGGRINPKGYDSGGLVFDPELSSELYQPDRESDEYRREVFSPDRQRLEGEKEAPQPDPESIPQRDYIDRVDSGEAPDFREALLKHGQEKLAAPGNENYLNRNLPAQAYSSGAGGDDVPMPRSNPFAMNTSGGNGVGAINRAAPLAARPGMPGTAMALDGEDAPDSSNPLRVPSRSRSLEELEKEVIREELSRKREPAPEAPPLPDMRRRKGEPRPWGGFDGRLMEMGLRLMASTGDRDSNGVPIGFGAGLGKAGIGTLESEKKHREEQRKIIEEEMEDKKILDNMQKWRVGLKENTRTHDMADSTRRLTAVGRSQISRDQSEQRAIRQKAEADFKERQQKALEDHRAERRRQLDEQQADRQARTRVAQERLKRGDLVWMGQDAQGNAIMYDKRRTDENGQPVISRVPVGDIIPKPRAKPQGVPSPVEVQQEARRLAEIDAKYRDLKPADMTKHMEEVLPKYTDMVRTMWGLQGGPAPKAIEGPSNTPPQRSGQNPDLATEVARLKSIGKKWPEIQKFLQSQGVNPDLYAD
tara:strand:- start:87 stop:1811 length:1725 start_codon:yes stop_codon:yes gene_type:complete